MNLQQAMMATLLVGVLGCNPFNVKQEQTKQSMAVSKAKAQKINKAYTPDIREVQPYEVYSYESNLEDPFRLRQFLIQKEKEKQITQEPEKKSCLPPSCVPPEPHDKQFLEGYRLNELKYVGTLDNTDALIKTPDYGVMKARIGDYIGFNNGRIIAIKDTALVIQEKIHKSGLWTNKKTVLIITR